MPLARAREIARHRSRAIDRSIDRAIDRRTIDRARRANPNASIAISIAWYVQRIISAFHSAIRGGLMCSRGVLAELNSRGLRFDLAYALPPSYSRRKSSPCLTLAAQEQLRGAPLLPLPAVVGR